MPSAFRSLLNPYPARLLPEEGALTTLQGTVLEAKFMSTLWNAPGYPLNMLCQKLLICDEYAHHRGRLGVLTPFQLTWCMVLREPVHKSWQGFGFLLLHVYVRDWQRIWANHLLVPRLLPLWLAIRKQIRRAWALIPAFRSIPRVVLSGARHSGRRICGVLFGLFFSRGRILVLWRWPQKRPEWFDIQRRRKWGWFRPSYRIRRARSASIWKPELHRQRHILCFIQ